MYERGSTVHCCGSLKILTALAKTPCQNAGTLQGVPPPCCGRRVAVVEWGEPKRQRRAKSSLQDPTARN